LEYQKLHGISPKKQEEKRKNAFISVASHELKTPLTTVLMNTQMMQQHATIFGEKSAQIGTKIESQSEKNDAHDCGFS